MEDSLNEALVGLGYSTSPNCDPWTTAGAMDVFRGKDKVFGGEAAEIWHWLRVTGKIGSPKDTIPFRGSSIPPETKNPGIGLILSRGCIVDLYKQINEAPPHTLPVVKSAVALDISRTLDLRDVVGWVVRGETDNKGVQLFHVMPTSVGDHEFLMGELNKKVDGKMDPPILSMSFVVLQRDGMIVLKAKLIGFYLSGEARVQVHDGFQTIDGQIVKKG
jgi:hypothetical protein